MSVLDLVVLSPPAVKRGAEVRSRPYRLGIRSSVDLTRRDAIDAHAGACPKPLGHQRQLIFEDPGKSGPNL